jgi:CRP/FNR family transcriptional regulator, cyclic AMP receptor protein
MVVGGGSVHLLEADPELSRGLDPRRTRELAERLLVRAVDVPPGPWNPRRLRPTEAPPIGLLVIGGALVREASVGEHPSAELLGPGDLVRTWEDPADQDMLMRPLVAWTALTPVRLAVIDRAAAERAAAVPEVLARLVERAALRAERLAVLQALRSLTRVEDRLVGALWALADRWGRVVPGGVAVDLQVPHRTLAGMIGARRPSVTTGLGHLAARGVLERRPNGGWLLRGEPPRAPGALRSPARFERGGIRA